MNEIFAFKIQGSSKNPYEIKFYCNDNELKYVDCTCPASSVNGLVCKHILALLGGDYENLVSGDNNKLDKVRDFIKNSSFKQHYENLKKLLPYEKYYLTLRDNQFFVNGRLNDNIDEIVNKLSENLIIKIRKEKNFSEDTFTYSEKSYLDFFTKDIVYLFSTKIDLLENKLFMSTLRKNKYKIDTSFKNQDFYVNSREIKEALKHYSSVKKEISEIRKELRYIVESLF